MSLFCWNTAFVNKYYCWMFFFFDIEIINVFSIWLKFIFIFLWWWHLFIFINGRTSIKCYDMYLNSLLIQANKCIVLLNFNTKRFKTLNLRVFNICIYAHLILHISLDKIKRLWTDLEYKQLNFLLNWKFMWLWIL